MRPDRLILGVVLCVAVAQAAAEESGDAAKGEKLFAQCKACHQVGEGAKTRVGPHLNGLFGRTAGSIEGFRYSKALESAGAEGLEWNDETLSAFIADPRGFAKGTRMSYRGMEDATERADLIAYLRGFSDETADADPGSSGAEHSVDPAILALEGDPNYGEYLSSECKACHQSGGGGGGIPSIALWPVEDFVTAMHAYKDKARPNPVMQMVAGRLSNEEIAALAAYFKDLDE